MLNCYDGAATGELDDHVERGQVVHVEADVPREPGKRARAGVLIAGLMRPPARGVAGALACNAGLGGTPARRAGELGRKHGARDSTCTPVRRPRAGRLKGAWCARGW